MAGKAARLSKAQPAPAPDATPAVAPFLVKTHQMVEDPATDHVISWTPSGASFVVWNPADLARDILPNHFKHNNFSSFVRQLNTYGFRKVASERWEFTNDNFQRAEPDLLPKILRRKPSAGSKPPAQVLAAAEGQSPSFTPSKEDDQSSSSTTSHTPLPPQHGYGDHNQEQQQQVILQDNEKLKKENHILTVELDNAKRQCQMLMEVLSSYVDVSNLNANTSPVASNTGAVATPEARGGEAKRGTQFKLFGVCLNEFAGDGKQEPTNYSKRKRLFCNQDIDSIAERPVKMAGFFAQ